ncbi:MAG: GAF domain-containing protein, partial [Actinomycetota bacterium]|nr:GAF domain-containing protein [Actinomycetota bacterium]
PPPHDTIHYDEVGAAMSMTVADVLLGAATRLSEKTSDNGYAGSPKPPSRAMVRVAGPNPFRVLLLGSGPVVGFGVLTHELALGGHLARRIAGVTGSGIDMDVVTEAGLHSRDLLSLATEVVAARYDLVIVSVGMQDVIDCTPVDDWSADVEQILGRLTAATDRVIPVHVVAVPQVTKLVGLEHLLGHAADNRAVIFNTRLKAQCEQRAGVSFVPFPLEGNAERCHQRTSDTYRRWADALMRGISPALRSLRHDGRPLELEEHRQAALNQLGILDAGPNELFDSITSRARHMLGTVGAGISLIDHHRQWFASSSGIPVAEIPRSETLCTHTITTNHGLVVEDATLDARFANGFFVVTAKLRSYAGVPIRDPQGYMIGALCVYDDKPRTFLPAELTLLRHLAHIVEEHLLTIAGDPAHFKRFRWASPRQA